VDRREILKGAMAGALTIWASRRLSAQQPAGGRLTDKLAVVEGGGVNGLTPFAFAAPVTASRSLYWETSTMADTTSAKTT